MRRAALDNLYRARAFRWRRSRVTAWTAMAACLVACVSATFLFLNAQPRVYGTDVGERRSIVLADGSQVSMDGATQVRVRYADGQRQFWLDRGRAKFTVARDPFKPFTVSADGKVIVATGTQFSVERLSDQLRVALYEGHVAVLNAGEKGSAPQPVMAGGKVAERALTPGHELVAPSHSKVAQVVLADPVRSLSWETGQLVFENEPLASAVERINRHAERPLRVTDAASRDIRISGVFAAGQEEAFVQGVVSLFPLKAMRSDAGTVLDLDRNRTGVALRKG